MFGYFSFMYSFIMLYSGSLYLLLRPMFQTLVGDLKFGL